MQRFRTLSLIQRQILVLLLITILCWGGILLLAIAPGGHAITVDENDASIYFAVDRRLVNNSGDCVTISWRLDNTDSLYVDGRGQVGEGSDEFCIDGQGESTTLRAIFMDGTEKEYTLHVGVIAYQPLVWILLFAGLFSLVSIFWIGIGWTIRPIRQATPLVQVPLWLFFSLSTTFIIGEFGLRYHVTNEGTSREQRMYLYTDEQLRAENVSQPMPFLNIAPIAGGENNTLGYRGQKIELPKPDGVFRIVALGDSTTHGIGVSPQNTYIAQLGKILRDDYGYTQVETVNAGIPGYTTWGHVVSLAFRYPEVEPDLVIVYTAVLDLSVLFNAPECYRGSGVYRGFPASSPMIRVGNQPLSPSALHRFIAIQLGWMENPSATDRFLVQVIPCHAEPISEAESIERNPPIYFERNIRALVGIGMGHDIPVVLSTWGYDAQEQDEEWWLTGIANHNNIIQRVAEETNVPLIDLAATDFINTPDYWFSDGIHQSIEGHRAQAEIYAAFLVDAGLIPNSAR